MLIYIAVDEDVFELVGAGVTEGCLQEQLADLLTANGLGHLESAKLECVTWKGESTLRDALVGLPVVNAERTDSSWRLEY